MRGLIINYQLVVVVVVVVVVVGNPKDGIKLKEDLLAKDATIPMMLSIYMEIPILPLLFG